MLRHLAGCWFKMPGLEVCLGKEEESNNLEATDLQMT